MTFTSDGDNGPPAGSYGCFVACTVSATQSTTTTAFQSERPCPQDNTSAPLVFKKQLSATGLQWMCDGEEFPGDHSYSYNINIMVHFLKGRPKCHATPQAAVQASVYVTSGTKTATAHSRV